MTSRLKLVSNPQPASCLMSTWALNVTVSSVSRLKPWLRYRLPNNEEGVLEHSLRYICTVSTTGATTWTTFHVHWFTISCCCARNLPNTGREPQRHQFGLNFTNTNSTKNSQQCTPTFCVWQDNGQTSMQTLPCRPAVLCKNSWYCHMRRDRHQIL